MAWVTAQSALCNNKSCARAFWAGLRFTTPPVQAARQPQPHLQDWLSVRCRTRLASYHLDNLNIYRHGCLSWPWTQMALISWKTVWAQTEY
jgi:hypothetical protein